MTQFVRIVNPKRPGEWLVLHRDDFDPAVHTLFVEAPVSIETAAAEVAPEHEISAPTHEIGADAQPIVAPAPMKPTRTRKPKPAVTPAEA